MHSSLKTLDTSSTHYTDADSTRIYPGRASMSVGGNHNSSGGRCEFVAVEYAVEAGVEVGNVVVNAAVSVHATVLDFGNQLRCCHCMLVVVA